MEFQKTINLLKKLLVIMIYQKKKKIRKKTKEIKEEKPILSFNINHDSIV